MFQLKIAFVAIALLEILRLGESYLITIDARAQDCYHERVQSGTKLSKCQSITIECKKKKQNQN